MTLAWAEIARAVLGIGVFIALAWLISERRRDFPFRTVLIGLASQFALAKNMPDGVRNPIGRTDDDGNWIPHRPDPKLFEKESGPHDKGAVFTRAVFEAFRSIYESRIADLRRRLQR